MPSSPAPTSSSLSIVVRSEDILCSSHVPGSGLAFAPSGLCSAGMTAHEPALSELRLHFQYQSCASFSLKWKDVLWAEQLPARRLLRPPHRRFPPPLARQCKVELEQTSWAPTTVTAYAVDQLYPNPTHSFNTSTNTCLSPSRAPRSCQQSSRSGSEYRNLVLHPQRRGANV